MHQILRSSLFLFLLCATALSAQTGPALEISAGPSQGFRHLTITDDAAGDPFVADAVQRRERTERPGTGWHLGVTMQYPISRQLAIRGGVRWSALAYHGDPALAPTWSEFLPWCGMDILSPRYTRFDRVRFHFLEIPVAVRTAHHFGRFSVLAQGGLSPAWLIRARGRWEQTNEYVYPENLSGWADLADKRPDLDAAPRHFHLFATVSAGFGYQLTPRLALNVLPAARYALEPIKRDIDVVERLYSFGLDVGLAYAL